MMPDTISAEADCPVPAEVVNQKCPLPDDKFSLAEYALERRHDEHIAVRHYGRNMAGTRAELTYRDVKQAAYFVANLLADNNIGKGDTVFIMGWNSWEMVALYWGAHYIGAVVPVASPMHVDRSYLLKYTKARAVVAPRSILPQLREEIDDKTHVKLLILTDNDNRNPKEEEGEPKQTLIRPACPGNVDSLGDQFDADAPEDSVETKVFDGAGRAAQLNDKAQGYYESIQASSEALWYFTSGTTGKPKGCVHKQIDLAYAAEMYARNVLGLAQGKTTATDILMASPYAMGSNLVFPFICGATVFLDHRDLSNNNATVDLLSPGNLRKTEAQVLISIPPSIKRLARELHKNPYGDLASAMTSTRLSLVTSSGAPLQPSTYRNFKFASEAARVLVQVLDGMGTAELQHTWITNFLGDVRSGMGFVGRIVPGYEWKLLNEHTSEGKLGKEQGWVEGDLMIRASRPDIVINYATRRQPKNMDFANMTKLALYETNDGGAPWYKTGDVTALGTPLHAADGNKWFYLLGRRSDLADQILGGGESRSLGTHDLLRKAQADQIMLAAGLYQKIETIRIALGSNISHDALVSSAFPINLMKGKVDTEVYVTVITKPYWPSAEMPSIDIVKKWKQYIKDNANVKMLVFVAEDQIPHTAPPMNKPIINVMKKQISEWLKTNKKEVTEDVCMEMSQARVVKATNRSDRSAKLLPWVTFGAPLVFLSLLLGFM